MKTYLVTYESSKNCFKGSLAVEAVDLVMAQDKFFSWLKRQPVYTHMWDLTINIDEIQGRI